MHVVPQNLKGRAFLLQFIEILQEFGDIIPWLYPLRKLRYTTNTTYFRDVFLQELGCKEPSEITPLQLLTPGRERDYVGGIIHFTHSPEVFRDYRNRDIQELLSWSGAYYVSCLQVRGIMRGRGHGRNLMQRSLRSVLATYHRVWGVVSDPTLLPWYMSFGAQVLSPRQNEDNLWIVVWE